MNQTLVEEESGHEAMKSAGIGSWEVDVESNSLRLDDLSAALLTVPPGNAGTYLRLLDAVEVNDRPRLDKAFRDALRENGCLDIAVRIPQPVGTERWVELKGRRSGSATKLRGVAIDISVHKAREAELLDRVASLILANKELDAFSSSVAHDLKAPLTALAGFSDMLRDECGNAGTENCRYCLSKVKTIVFQMNAILDNLLFMARMTAPDIVKTDVDLGRIIRLVIDDLKKANPGRDIAVSIQPELRADADENLIAIVLTNLLGNAWKFTGTIEKPEIAVGCSMINNRKVYFVRDNGVGFDMKEAHKLFKPMQRLYTAKNFQGSGIGLALANRIIKKHGGSMWTESEPGKGATFYFTLE